MTYLSLKPAVRFVRGPRRSALYDLARKRIYPLDEWTTRLLGESLAGRPLEDVLASLGIRETRPRRLVTRALAEHPLLRTSRSRKEPPAAAPALGSGDPGASTAARPLVGPSGRLTMAPPAAAPARQRLDFLWLELTERCNLRCVHCYAGSGPGLKDGPMATEDHRRVLRQAAAAGCRAVQFNGGEATLNPDLPRLVQEAIGLGFETIEIYTNATLLNEERIRFFKEHGVRVAVSFYSHRPEVHEAITRVPGSFRRTLEAIQAMLRAGLRVRAGLVRMRLNQEDIAAARDLLVSLGVATEAITMDDVRPAGRGCGDSLVPAGGKGKLQAPPGGEWMQTGPDGELGCRTCWSGKVAVAPSGDVYPCIFSRELPAGNVLRGSLQEVIGGETLRDLWSIDKAQIPVCKDCEFRYGCFDCRALAYKQTGELRSKPPSCAYDPYTGTWEGVGAESSAPPLDDAAVPVRGRGLRWALAGEIGLLYSSVGRALVAVNRVAVEVWRMCDGRSTLRRIACRLARRYGAPETEVRRDVQALVRSLAGMGMLEVRAA